MKKILKVFVLIPLIFISLISTALFGFVEPSDVIIVSKVFENEHQVVVFLSKENAQVYISDDPYFERVNDYFDTSIRLKEDLSGNGAEQNKAILKEYTKDQILDWEEKEIKRVYAILKDAQSRISLKTKEVLQDTLYLIKSSGEENFNAYYTAKKAIVIPKTELKFLWIPPRKKDVAETYIHEYLHILTRENKQLRNELYSIIGFDMVENFNIPKELESRRITNPDFLELNYAITLKDSKGNSDRYSLLLTSKHEKYNGKIGFKSRLNILLGYADVSLYKLDKTGKVIDKKVAFNQGFFDQVGKISSYRYGADEIIAEAFQVMISEDYKKNYSYSRRDIEIMDKIQITLSQ